MTPADRLADEGLVWVDGFVGEAECAEILDELRWAWWTPSTVVNRFGGDDLVSFRSGVRTSETTTQWWFPPRLLELMGSVEQRLRETFGIDPLRLETWQATRYGPGGHFNAHFDAGLWGAEPAGERTHTVLLYLDEPEAGGGTEFPCRYLVVDPRPGRLLVWNNLRDGRVDRLMSHASLPVERGAKTTLVTWGRERPVRQPSEREDSCERSTTRASSSRS